MFNEFVHHTQVSAIHHKESLIMLDFRKPLCNTFFVGVGYMVLSIKEAVIMTLITSGGTATFDGMTYLLKVKNCSTNVLISIYTPNLSVIACRCLHIISRTDVI